MARALQHRPGLLKLGDLSLRPLRTLLRVAGLVLFGLLALLLILIAASQTAPFKEWVRGLVVRQAGQYLNGTLAIDRLAGSLFTNVELDGVALRHEGKRAVSVDKVIIQYSILTLIREGVVLDRLSLTRPMVHLERDAAGWNFMRFVKTRERTGERQTIGLQDIEIAGGHVEVGDLEREPYVFDDLNSRLRFSSSPDQIVLAINSLSSRIAPSDISMRQLSGSAYFQEDNVDVRDLRMITDRSDVTGRVVLRHYQTNGAVEGTVRGEPLSLPELSRFVPALSGMKLEPRVSVDAQGSLDQLHLDVALESPSGRARGPLIADLREPNRSLGGTLDLDRVNVAPLFSGVGETRITGQSSFEVRFPDNTRESAAVSFRFSGPEVLALGYHVTNAQAQGSFEDRLLRVDGRGAAYGASARARAVVRFPAVDGGPVSYATSGQFANLDLTKLPPTIGAPPLESRLAGSFDLQGERRRLIANVKLNESVAEGATIASGTTAYVSWLNGALDYTATGHVSDLDVQRLGEPLRVPTLSDERFQTRLNADFKVHGSGRSLDELRLDVDATFVESVALRGRFPQLHVDMHVADRRLAAAVQGPFENLDPAVLGERRLDPTTLNGVADMMVVVAQLGAPLTPMGFEATGQLTLTKSAVAGVTIDTAEINGAYVDRVARLDRVTVSGPDISANTSGVLALDEQTESQLQYDVTLSNLTLLTKFIDRPVSGSAHLQGTVTGNSAQLTSVGTLSANQLKYGDSVDILTLNSKFTATVPDLQFSRASGRADSTAAFVSIGGYDLTEMFAETIYSAPELQFRTSFAEQRRSVEVGGRALLHPDHQEVHLRTLSLGIGQTVWRLPEGQEARVRYGDRVVTLTGLELRRAEQLLAVNGTFLLGEADAAPVSASDVQIRAEQLQIKDINELVLGKRQVSGILNGSARVTGAAGAPEVEAMFAITGGQVEGVPFEAFSGEIDYRDRNVSLDVQLRQSAAASLTAMGRLPVSLFRPSSPGADDPLDLRVQSSGIDATLLQSLTTHVENLRGQLQVDLRATGTARTPQVDGHLNVTGASFRVATTGAVYTGLNSRLRFAGDRLVVDQFSVLDDDGDLLSAEGAIGIQERRIGAFDVVGSAARFKILDNQLGHIELDTLFRLTGDAQHPVIEGNIETRSGRLEIDQLLEQFTGSPYRVESAESTSASSPSLFDALSLAVKLRVRDNLVLRGRNIRARFSRIGLGAVNMTIGGDVELRKAPNDQTRLVGTVTVVRGFYDFQGRRFDVERDSFIRFEGVDPLDPTLRIAATRVISGVVTRVDLRGTVRAPELQLSSQPPLDEADILSLIVFNQPVNELGQNERVSLAERAGAIAAGYVTSALANSIGRALDLDLFEIRTAGEAGSGPLLSIGEQLGSRLFVGFKQEFGPAEVSQLSFEYRITELLRLVTSIAQGTRRTHRTQRLETSAADLILVISY